MVRLAWSCGAWNSKEGPIFFYLVNFNQSSAIVYSCYSLNPMFEVVVANICLICTFDRWKRETKLFGHLWMHYDLTWFTFQRTPQTTWHFMWIRNNTNLDLWFGLHRFCHGLPAHHLLQIPRLHQPPHHPPLQTTARPRCSRQTSRRGDLVWTNWKEECQVLTWTWLDNS